MSFKVTGRVVSDFVVVLIGEGVSGLPETRRTDTGKGVLSRYS